MDRQTVELKIKKIREITEYSFEYDGHSYSLAKEITNEEYHKQMLLIAKRTIANSEMIKKYGTFQFHEAEGYLFTDEIDFNVIIA
jgi:NifU-like protein involved in Fe-S cluster formation